MKTFFTQFYFNSLEWACRVPWSSYSAFPLDPVGHSSKRRSPDGTGLAKTTLSIFFFSIPVWPRAVYLFPPGWTCSGLLRHPGQSCHLCVVRVVQYKAVERPYIPVEAKTCACLSPEHSIFISVCFQRHVLIVLVGHPVPFCHSSGRKYGLIVLHTHLGSPVPVAAKDGTWELKFAVCAVLPCVWLECL